MDRALVKYLEDDTVQGWFPLLDFLLFDWILSDQEAAGTTGGLAEIGVFQGRSAILLGFHQRPGEAVCVCDVFDGEISDESNRMDYERWYTGQEPTRMVFERNYRRFHGRLPEVIVEAPSDHMPAHVAEGTLRFLHIDGSHLYKSVAGDIDRARALLAPSGIVVCDDYRTEHSPGTGAAVWEAVFDKGLRPICLTAQKFYATWTADVPAIQARLKSWVPTVDCVDLGMHVESLDEAGELVHVYVHAAVQGWTRPGSGVTRDRPKLHPRELVARVISRARSISSSSLRRVVGKTPAHPASGIVR